MRGVPCVPLFFLFFLFLIIIINFFKDILVESGKSLVCVYIAILHHRSNV